MARRYKLKRTLGIFLVTIYGLGNIVGAGIYALVGNVAGEAGTATPLAFLLASIVAGFSALSFAELSSRKPYSEGVSAYVHNAFRRKPVSIAVGALMAIATVVSAAALARAFGGYLYQYTGIFIPLGAALIIITFGLLSAWGIEESAKLAAVLTVIEVLGLGVIIWLGRGSIVASAQTPVNFFDISSVGITGVLSAVFLAFYAYIGVEDIVHLSEETKKPRLTVPLAIIGAVTIATVLYTLVSIVAIDAVPLTELNKSAAPVGLIFTTLSSTPGWAIAIIALAATAGGVLAHIISGSRLLFGMAEAGWLHKRLAIVHETRKTPTVTIAVVVAVSIVLSTFAEVKTLALVTSYLILIIFSLVDTSLIIIKIRDKNTKKPIFSVSIIVPILGLVFSILLLVVQTSILL